MSYDPATRRYYLDQDLARLLKNESQMARIVMLMDAMEKVCEAAQNHETMRNRCCEFDLYESSRKVLQEALADLERARKGTT